MSTSTRRVVPWLLGVGLTSALLGVILRVTPPSHWLQKLTPDGALETGTAQFLDTSYSWALLLAILALTAAWSPTFRAAGRAAWLAPATPQRPGFWIPVLAGVGAVVLRIIAAAFGDVGLGDDGARVVWLERWLLDPAPVWTGMWLPGHLYLHALLNVVARDAVWSGVLLSAFAAGGTVGILTRAVESHWGRVAAASAGFFAAILPVSVAFGATPDVNPVFAFFVIAATAAVLRARNSQRRSMWILGWLCIVLATWMRFDSVILVPAIALLLWRRPVQAVAFTVAGLLPLVLWNVADSLITQQPARVMNVVHQDPTLGGSLVSSAFSFGGAIWRTLTPSLLILGLFGMVRALRANCGRAWMLLPLAHVVLFAGTTVLFSAGTQSRYFILAASVFAAYAGIAIGGMMQQAKGVGLAILLLATVLVVVAPPLFPPGDDLWIRRNPTLRALVDEVEQQAAGRDILWAADKSAFFYACRTRPPVEQFHAMSRFDSDPQVILTELDSADAAIACIQRSPLFEALWGRFEALATKHWNVRLIEERNDYRIFALDRKTGSG